MPRYQYKAARSDGEVIEGQIDASDPKAAAQRLQAEGQTPLQISEFNKSSLPGSTAGLSFRRERLSAKDLELFTLQLSTLLRAKLPLAQALDTLHQLAEKMPVKTLAGDINDAVRRGDSLSNAMEASSSLFDRFYLNMVKAGEATGALDLALESLASFKTNAREMRESLISSLIYPGILLTLALVAVAVLLAFVVPQFTSLFDQAGRDLPLLTRIVAGAGEIVTHWWWAILGAIALAVFAIRQQWQTPQGQEKRDYRLLRLPIAGTLILKLETARFTRTLATLLQNGVPLLTAMDIAKEIVSNRVVAKSLVHAAQRVRQGESLSAPLADSRQLPDLAIQLIQVGEQTGELEHMLGQLADIYEKEVETGLKRLLSLVEPMIIVMVALFVSVIILSVVMLIMASNDLVF